MSLAPLASLAEAPTTAEPARAAFGFVYPEDAAAEEQRELEEPESQIMAEPNAGSVVPEQPHKDDDREELRDPQPVGEDAPAESIVQDTLTGEKPLSSSLFRVPTAESGQGRKAGRIEAGFKAGSEASRGVSRTRRSDPNEPPTARDAEALKAIARLRVLSYEQLRARVFPGHPTLVGRRMQKLEQAGWVVRYEDRLAEGGHPYYVFPTVKTMRWARRQFQAAAEGHPHAQLVTTMMPNIHGDMYTSDKQPVPGFLRHQELTNEVAHALEANPTLGVQWMSTWPRPFPHAFAQLQLPQPDLVFVASINGAPQLFFGELDHHSNESLAHFKDRKADRALALRYSGLLPELTGFAQFQMLVVVSDTNDPISRAQKLIDVTNTASAESLFAFTLAPWLLNDQGGAIWFADGLTPECPSLTYTDHDGLKRLDQLASACAASCCVS